MIDRREIKWDLYDFCSHISSDAAIRPADAGPHLLFIGADISPAHRSSGPANPFKVECGIRRPGRATRRAQACSGRPRCPPCCGPPRAAAGGAGFLLPGVSGCPQSILAPPAQTWAPAPANAIGLEGTEPLPGGDVKVTDQAFRPPVPLGTGGTPAQPPPIRWEGARPPATCSQSCPRAPWVNARHCPCPWYPPHPCAGHTLPISPRLQPLAQTQPRGLPRVPALSLSGHVTALSPFLVGPGALAPPRRGRWAVGCLAGSAPCSSRWGTWAPYWVGATLTCVSVSVPEPAGHQPAKQPVTCPCHTF